MSTWTPEDLALFDQAQEIRITTVRKDGSLRRPLPIWIVRVADDLYIRSVNGPDAAWYKGTKVSHEGQISTGGETRDVAFADADADTALDDAIDAAYAEKYARYPSIVPSMQTAQVRGTSTRVLPR